MQKGCYVFTLDDADSVSQRPWKRRKTELARAPADQNAELPFGPLLKGFENVECTRSRFEGFEFAWHPKENLLKRIYEDASIETVKEVVSFVQSADPAESDGKLRTGLIVTGPDDSVTASLFDSIAESANLECRTVLVTLSSGQSPNLKTVLKYINQRATSQKLDSQNDALFDEAKDGRRLDYDLQVLHDHVQRHSIDMVLLSFRDSEAFEGKVLDDLVRVLRLVRS